MFRCNSPQISVKIREITAQFFERQKVYIKHLKINFMILTINTIKRGALNLQETFLFPVLIYGVFTPPILVAFT